MTVAYFSYELASITLWLEVTSVAAVVLALLILFVVRLNRLKHQKMELQRLLVEKNELITYAAEREQKAFAKAAEIDQTKKTLLSRINREIRTPMNGIMGMVSLLEETPLTNEQKEYKDTIRNCGESLVSVIHDILLSDVLAYSKVESGTAELEQKDFDLRNAIEEVFAVFANAAAQKDIELVYQVDQRIASHVGGDQARLRQILMNLVENSIKFTKGGEIYITVAIGNAGDNTLELDFEVRDSGVGIAPHDLKFLLQTMNDPGAQRPGVGLFLCNRLVGMMGGSLTLDSRTNHGTTVRFNLQFNRSLLVERLHSDIKNLAGKKVLIVEDNSVLRNVLQQQLLHWNLVPIVAENGRHALEILSEKQSIDLVLAEMQMPKMDGMMLSGLIREKYPALPIVLLSNSTDEGIKQRTEILTSLVTKPLRINALSQHIFSALIPKDEAARLAQVSARQKFSSDFSTKYPLRILIAEDNPMNQKLALKILAKLGYKADVVGNGKELLEQVSKLDYDVIFMDVQMPEMDGLEATRMIRLCLSTQPIIIAMTANAMQGDREECMRAGMDDYLSKPVKIEELVITLEKWALQVNAKNNRTV
jgi:CheY-like chemotaxis protein/signal transduction histidine kinase